MTKVVISDDEQLLKDYKDKHDTEDTEYYCLSKPTLDFIENPDEFADLYQADLSVAEMVPRVFTYLYQKYPVKEITGKIDVITIDNEGLAMLDEDGNVETHKETGVVATENTFDYLVLTNKPDLYYVKLCVCDEANICAVSHV